MAPFDHSKNGMPRLAEEEEQMLNSNGGSASSSSSGGRFGSHKVTPRVPPPQLPLSPTALTPEQQKRRHIIASLVHSENNYVATLQRLVNVSTVH